MSGSDPARPLTAPGAAAAANDGDVLPAGVLRFREFEVRPGTRTLLLRGNVVPIGSRAFDLLVVLLAARGQLVATDAIFAHVWPSTIVEQSNLRFQMATLRKALGPHRDAIKTIPGRGYMLVDDRQAPGPRPGSATPALTISRSPADRPTVVVIDDDIGTREALTGLLRSVGMAVEPFGSVGAFLERASTVEPGCLILDVWMPGQSGLDFQVELVRRGRRPPIIFISGHADVPMSVQAMKAGAVEFLTKPVRHQDLLDAVRQAIDRPAGHREAVAEAFG